MRERAWKVRNRIHQWIGIPCGVGIGQTKTLSKLANHIAKTADRKPGSYPAELATVCDLSSLSKEQLREIMTNTAVGDVWGIGRQIGAQLVEQGVTSVQAFIDLPSSVVRASWGVVLERTWRELRGEDCIAMSEIPEPRKQIACTRSFGRAITEFEDLREAISTFTSKAAEKLRKQNQLAGQILVFARTSPFREGPRFGRSMVVPLIRPTADTTELANAAIKGLRSIYAPGYEMAKAGVMLLDLVPDTFVQGELNWEGEQPHERDRSKLMKAMDEVNGRFGKRTVLLGSSGVRNGEQTWGMRQLRKTPNYTTCWDEVPVARA